MALIDEKGRLFGRVNIIDLILVLGVVIATAFIYVTLTKQGKVTSVPENRIVDYTVVVRGLRPDVVGFIRKGDLVKKQANQAPIGRIKAIEVKPSQVTIGPDAEGKFIMIDSPTDKDAYITIEAVARVGTDLVATGNEILHVNDKFIITTKWFVGDVTIIDMTVRDRHQSKKP